MARILVIDDEPLVLKTIRITLEGAGHQVTTASDGVAGMIAFGRGAFDLVITDILMPEQGGIETIVQMRSHAPAIKILALSGGARMGNAEVFSKITKLGANAMMAKPFDPADLVEHVSRLLG